MAKLIEIQVGSTGMTSKVLIDGVMAPVVSASIDLITGERTEIELNLVQNEQMEIETIRGYLLDEAEYAAFKAWRQNAG